MTVRSKSSPVTRSQRSSVSNQSVHNKIMRWLLRYPLQRVEDLMLALAASNKTVYRHLAQLIEEGLVEYITPSLSVKTTCRLYYLSQEGILAAAEQERAGADTLARQWGANEQEVLSLLPRLPALVRLQDFINGLIVQAPGMLAYPGGHRAELTWHWRRDYCHTFEDQGRQWNYEADAVLYFHRKGQSSAKGEDYCALLFIDPDLSSNDNARQVRRRLEAALRYRARVEQGYNGPMFPPLIVLARTPRQQEIWQHNATRVAAGLHAQPLIGAIAVVPSEQALENVWTLPWQKLSAAAPTRLRDLFLPLARDALPPGLLQPQSAASPSSPSSDTLLQGAFMQRARRLRTLSPAPESDDTEQETLALLGLCLSQRHLEVLHLLYRYPLLSIEEIAAFLNLQDETIIRYLYELRRYACVEKYNKEHGSNGSLPSHGEKDEKGNSSAGFNGTRWQLSPRGLHFLAASRHVLLQDIAEPVLEGDEQPMLQRGIARLKQQLPRTLAIYTFFAALYDGMHERSASGAEHSVVWWEMGSHCEHRYSYRGNRHTLRPAASFVCKVGQKRLSAWLELDGLIPNEPGLAARLETYALFVRSREWIAAGLSTLPMLLIVTAEAQRAEQIIELVNKHLAGTGMIVRLTVSASIAEHGPLATIWRQILPAPEEGRGGKKREPAQFGLLDTRQRTT